MSKFYPTAVDMTKETATNDITMDKNKFSHNFTRMFPKGRVFLNFIQLREAVGEFFKHWNLLSKSNGKSVRCSYSFTPATKKTISDSSEVINKNYQSTAALVKCPFQLKWSLTNHKKPYRHDIFHRVKISCVVITEHTCMMSHISYRHALKGASGHAK